MSSKFFFNPQHVPSELLPLCREAARFTPFFSENKGNCEISFELTGAPNAVVVSKTPQGYCIKAHSVQEAARGLGLALAEVEAQETTPFEKLGIMMDASRNKVPTVETVKKLLTQLALAGGNTLMLYTEDTYALEEPFFGYMRGGYTLAELQEIDGFAAALGIEVIGCIQTLGHMTQFLQWQAISADYADTRDILLVDEPKTYELIEKMFAFWSKALRSRRIHIGMDEAHSMGRGAWLDHHPFESQFSIFNRHLAKVNELARKYGYDMPTIWSDMYFRIGDPKHNYYNDTPISQEVKDAIPTNVQLCYWDYYNEKREFYLHYIDRHREISSVPMMMGSGIWTWAKFWYDHNFSSQTAHPCIEACRQKGVTELIFTMWGDDGGYCIYESALCGIIDSFNRAWGLEDDKANAAMFQAVTGEDWTKWLAFSKIESEGEITPDFYYYHPAVQLWDDPLLAIRHRFACKLDADYPTKMLAVYRSLLANAEDTEADPLPIRTVTALVRFLEKKLQFRLNLEHAWKAKDRGSLRSLAQEIPALLQLLEKLDQLHRDYWLSYAKPLGLEVIQARNGAQVARLKECGKRLEEFCDGKCQDLPELEASMSLPSKGDDRGWYRFIASGSCIK